MATAVPRFLQRLATPVAGGLRPALAPRFAPTAAAGSAGHHDVAGDRTPAAAPAVPAGAPWQPAPVADAPWLAPPAPHHAASLVVDVAVPEDTPRRPPEPSAQPVAAQARTAAFVAPTPPRSVSRPAEAAPRTAVPLHTAVEPVEPVEPVTPAAPQPAATAFAPQRPAPLRAATVQQHAALQRQAERPTVVQVTIDRIDVRAAAPAAREPQPAARPRANPTLPLADYLRRRAPGGRG